MQWSDVTRRPSTKLLRQFAGLCLAASLGLAVWLGWTDRLRLDSLRVGLAAGFAGIGLLGLAWPAAIRPIYTGWMIAAFPIGWVVSRVVLGLVYWGLVTPLALVFRVIGRDALHRRSARQESYWTPKGRARDVREYFRQF